MRRSKLRVPLYHAIQSLESLQAELEDQSDTLGTKDEDLTDRQEEQFAALQDWLTDTTDSIETLLEIQQQIGEDCP